MFVAGLLLIPFGMWREGRRRKRGNAAWKWPAVDLQLRRSRIIVAAVVFLTLVNVVVVAVAGLGVTHYMESTTFCGQACHEPMQPEFTAHQVSCAQQRGLCVVSRRPGRARHHQGQDERHPADVPVRHRHT